MDNKSYMKQVFVTPKEAAEILGVDVRTIRAMVKSGKLRAKDTNATGNQRKYWKILREDLYKSDPIETQPAETQ